MSSTANIKALILDFGGVIYRIDHDKQKEVFESFGLKDFHRFYSQAEQDPLFREFETGCIDEAEFRERLTKILPPGFPPGKTDEAWNSILGEYDPDAVDLLMRLKTKYRLFILSNTNIIHYRVYIPQFYQTYGFDFESLFEKTYWSFRCGMRKPDAGFFNLVLRENNLRAGECLFIDDTLQNSIAAKSYGIKTIWLAPGKTFSGLFDNNGNVVYDK